MGHDFKTDNVAALSFKNAQALHGDVIIEKIDQLPKNFEKMEKEKNSVLAYGEVTGHSHRLFYALTKEGSDLPAFDLRVDRQGTKFLVVREPTEVRHQEHDPRLIPPGSYKIGIQREYDPFSKKIRQVAD